MCPAASPAGVDPAPPVLGFDEPATQPSSPAFSRTAAARIVGLSRWKLYRWERSLHAEAGLDFGPSLTTSDLVALAVLCTIDRCLGGSVDEFTLGLARLFEALRDRPDVGRLDGYAALVGRDYARIAELRDDRLRCSGDDFLIIPLRPILAGFRDQAFA